MNNKRIIATVECRMTSSRLPGKVMLSSCGKPMLEHIVERLRRVPQLDGIAFATTVNSTDDSIARLAERLGVSCFRGSENDVLKRVLLTAQQEQADVIVEITGDCPLIDPEVTSQTVDLYLSNPGSDYVSNDLTLSYPLGMDVQVFPTELLALADKEGLTAPDREHVSWYIVRHPERFRLVTLPAPPSLRWPNLRLTLDEEDDFRLIDAIFMALYPKKPDFSLYDIVELLRNNQSMARINAHVAQKNPHDEA